MMMECNHLAFRAASFAMLASSLLAQTTAKRSDSEKAILSVPELTGNSLAPGRWKYTFSYVEPRIGKSEASDLAKAVAKLRDRVPSFAVATLSADELRFRQIAENGGKPRWSQINMRTLYVKSANNFFEWIDIDGGFQSSANIKAATHQDYVINDEVYRRTDCVDPSITTDFRVYERESGDVLDRTVLAEHWHQNFSIIKYCLRKGKEKKPGIIVVPESIYMHEPPYDTSLSLLGVNLVMHIARTDSTVSFLTTLFDQDGRVCYEWKSRWNSLQPLMLAEKSFLPMGPQYECSWELLISNREDKGFRFPDLMDMATKPFERRKVFNYRNNETFDPLDIERRNIGRNTQDDIDDHAKPAPIRGLKVPSSPSVLGIEKPQPLVVPDFLEMAKGDGEIRGLMFTLINPTDQVLSVKSITASCPCVQFTRIPRSLPPFGMEFIPFTVALSDLSKVIIKVQWRADGQDGESEVRLKRKNAMVPDRK